MKRIEPPSVLQSFLLLLLSPRDRETISGDLQEELIESKLPELGSFRARIWYLRQVLSFVPDKALVLLLQGPALKLLCFCTALAGSWLGLMDLLLRHPGYASQTGIAATIVLQALIALAALRFQRHRGFRFAATVGSLALLWLAASALKAAFGGAQLEGYVLLIALALIIQAVLTVLTLPMARVDSGKSA